MPAFCFFNVFIFKLVHTERKKYRNSKITSDLIRASVSAKITHQKLIKVLFNAGVLDWIHVHLRLNRHGI